jgi:hypothetical protein
MNSAATQNTEGKCDPKMHQSPIRALKRQFSQINGRYGGLKTPYSDHHAAC